MTRTGAWLDPLSDKVLLFSAVVTLAALGGFPVWAAAVILVREIAITLLRIRLGTRGQSLPASPLAKLKTGGQQLAVMLYLVPGANVLDPVPFVVVVIAVVLTVWSAVEYLRRMGTPAEPKMR